MNLNEMFEEWKGTLLHPAETLPKMVKKANLMAGIQHLAVGLVVWAVVTAIVDMVGLAAVGGAFGAAAGVMGAIVGAIGMFIAVLIFAGLMWVMAKILGGVGEYGAQLHMTSAPYAPVLIVSAVLNIIPLAGALLGMLVGLYYLYPLTIALREVHKLSTLKAVAVWLIPSIVLAIVFAIIGAVLLAMLGLAVAGAGYGYGYGY